MGEWKQSVFDCFGDLDIVFLGSAVPLFNLLYFISLKLGFFFCQPCTIGSMIAYQYQENPSFSHCLLGMCPPFLLVLRSDIRMANRIPGSVCDDALATLCCYPCTFCQVTKQYSQNGCDFYPMQL